MLTLGAGNLQGTQEELDIALNKNGHLHKGVLVMEIREKHRLILYAEPGKAKSVTDGMIIGPWLILAKR